MASSGLDMAKLQAGQEQKSFIWQVNQQRTQ